ncbi:MAG: SUMF1/EgtB/PvdO family nonheme iron enzyme [Planctomycetota bacterium]
MGGYLAFASLLLLVILATLRLFIEEPNPAGAVVHRVVVGEVRDRDVLPVSSRDLQEFQRGEAIWGLYREADFERTGVFEDPLRYPEIDSDYALGRYEVTNDQYLSFLLAVAERSDGLADNRIPSHWTRLSGSESFAVSRVYVRGTGDLPVVNVSVLDALEYANWFWEERLHSDPDRIADLPTANEFVRAGRGDKIEHNFPWGPAFGADVNVNWTRRRAVAVNSVEAGKYRGVFALVGNAAEWVHGPGTRMRVAGGSFDLRTELYRRYISDIASPIQRPWPDATPFQATTFDWRSPAGQKDVGFRLAVRPAAHRPTMVAVPAGRVRYRRPDERRTPPTTPDTRDPTVWDESAAESDDEFLPSVNLSLPIPAVWEIGLAFEREPDPDQPRRVHVAGVKLDRGEGVRAEFTRVWGDDGTDGTEGLEDPLEIEAREFRLGGQSARLRRWTGQIDGVSFVRLVVEAHMGQRYRLSFNRPSASESGQELDAEFESILAGARFQIREVWDPAGDFLLRVPSDPSWELEAWAGGDSNGGDENGRSLRARAIREGKASVSVYRVRWSGTGVFPREFPGVAKVEPLLGASDGILEEPAEFNGLGAVRRSFQKDESVSAFLFPRRLIDGDWVYAFVVRRIVVEPEVEAQLRRIASSFRFLHEQPVPLPSGEEQVEAGFSISRAPITNRQYLAFLVDYAMDHEFAEVAALRPVSFWRENERGRTFRGPWGDPAKMPFVFWPGEENEPVLLGGYPDHAFGTPTDTALRQAKAYAAWLGAQDPGHTYRLPTFAEYLRTGRGDAIHRFPWGDDPDDPDLVCRGEWYDADELRPTFLPGRLGSQARTITGLCGNVLEFVVLDGNPVLAGGWHDLTPDYCTLDSIIDPSWWPDADEPRGFRVVKAAK